MAEKDKKPKLKEATLADLIPDDRNFNKHTEYGMHLLEKSLSELGAGRSVLLDKNNRIIAGNGVIETAGNIGMENVVVVETDGRTIVAVKRTDVDLDSRQGRELALADNATSKANLSLDTGMIIEAMDDFEFDSTDWGIDPNDTGASSAAAAAADKDLSDKITESLRVEIECVDEAQQEKLYNEMIERGFSCRLLTL